jgi:hypothetical protein
VVTVLTTLTTFLSPNEKENAHLTAANAYDRLNNDARMFSSIECWSVNSSEEALTAKLGELVERKNKLNADSPQIPPWAWNLAQERINKGEATYEVDKIEKPKPPTGGVLEQLPKPTLPHTRRTWKAIVESRKPMKSD